MIFSFRTLALSFVTLFGTISAWAFPAIGSSAPSVESLKLLQAPAGANAGWASLKGKVVILEFWATWCSPCVAGLPHFNEVAAALDPAKFQFISIDDEDTKTIETFLARKKIAGWVGIDAGGKIFQRYGVASRPTTMIIDGNGKMVAVTLMDSVSAADLQAVAAGKRVAFKSAVEVTTSSVAPGRGADHSMLSVSVSKAAADSKMAVAKHAPSGTDFLGQDADSLFASVFDLFHGRYVLKGVLPDGRFDLREHVSELPQSSLDAVAQQAVLSALGLKVETKMLTRTEYVLRSTDASQTLIDPSASARGAKRGYWHGMFILMNGSMDDLAYLLATHLESPVRNETGLDVHFDARFEIAGDDIDSVNDELRKTLGLELVPGSHEASVTVTEVSQQSLEEKR